MKIRAVLFITTLAVVAVPFSAKAQQPAPAAVSCATDPSAVPPPVPDKALVYVFRESSMVGAAGHEIVFANGSLIGDFHSGNYAACAISPGSVILSSLERITKIMIGYALLADLQRQAKENLRMQAEPGKTYYIRMWPSGKMKLADEATALKEIHGLHLAKIKD